MRQKLVVIGNGMSGMHTVEELVGIAPERYNITVFGSEPYGNYNRIMLTPVLFGTKSIAEIFIHDFDWYKERDIILYCGSNKTIVDVDREQQQVIAKDGTKAKYDILLIATGSLPLMLDIPGIDAQGVMGFRNIADVQVMIEKAETKQHAVILGAGLLGLEAANGLLQRGMQVTVIHRADQVLNRQLDQQAALFLQREFERKGINFRFEVTIEEILITNQDIRQVRLSDGSLLPADLLVMATGIQPNIGLSKHIGLYCERGIVVNDYLQTSDTKIYAVGECIQHRGEVFGLVSPIYEQAKVCARQLADESGAVYQSMPWAIKLKVTGIDMFSIGNFHGDADCQELVLIDHAQGVYRKIVLKNDLIIGMIMYGDTTDSAWYLGLVKNKINIADIRDRLIFNQCALAA
jgi:nitrite reductase (NADH) large subunit